MDNSKVNNKNNMTFVSPNVAEPYSNIKKSVTASMFLNNKNLNIDEIKNYIENNKDYGTNDDFFIKKSTNIVRYDFKRHSVPNNTIICQDNNLKVVNPTKAPLFKPLKVKSTNFTTPNFQKPYVNKPNQQPNQSKEKNINNDVINKLIQANDLLKKLLNDTKENNKLANVNVPSYFNEPEESKKENVITYEVKNKPIKQDISPDIFFSYQIDANNNQPVKFEPVKSMFIKESKTIEPIVEHYIEPVTEPTIEPSVESYNELITKPEEIIIKTVPVELPIKEPILVAPTPDPIPLKIITKETVIDNPIIEQPIEITSKDSVIEQAPSFNETYEASKPIVPLKIITKDVVEEPYYEEYQQPEYVSTYEQEYIEMPKDNEAYNIEELRYVEQEQCKDKPQKLYRRLWEQETKDKIITNWELNLPTKGELIDYPDADYAIEMIDIYKSFDNGKVLANNGITLRVRRNNVHALIGENGAGKSVLMSILFGIYNADSGIIKINGEEVVFSSAKDAALKGIGMVHQHFKLVETDTVFENIILGLEETSALGFLKTNEARNKINNLIQRYNFNIDIDKKIADLNVADQQKTEILKLLYRDADILIFDEPTAVLSESEINQFLNIIKQLKNDGKTVILITHKFNEIKEVADRGTVIRLGTFISEFDINEKTEQQIINDMVGNDLELISNVQQGKYYENEIFEIKDLVIDEKITNEPINFKVHSGEIFAIAGVTGNGQSELALMIAGLLKNKTGEILIKHKNISHLSVAKRYEAGLAYVPEDRHKYSVILDLPIYMNTVINKVDKKPYSKSGFINLSNIKEYTRNFIRKNDIRGTSRGTTPIRNLSGGNQQKLVIARELDKDYDVLVLEQPTRGLDVSAINKIHKEILEEKAKGKAIVLISYELDEILSIADTVAVMNKYKIVKISNINDTNRNIIGKLMVGEDA